MPQAGFKSYISHERGITVKLERFLRVLFIGLSLLLLSLFSLLHLQQTSQAQDVMLSKVLNKADQVVRVGELISFTITLNNNAGFTLTNVTLVDNYASNVLAYAGALPVEPDVITPATGTLQWSNVAIPPISIGETLTFTVFFTVEHPETNPVVNFVRAEDIIGTGGAVADANAADQADEATGNMAPVVKFISPPGAIPAEGLPLTFTHIITNDGLAIMTFLPLTDTYDANFLEFNFAVPPPDITSPGQLVWTDLTTIFGDLPPFATVVITTVFTATTQVLNTTNEASTAGARDQFNNDLAGGQAFVGITIIGDTPVPVPTRRDDDDDEDDREDTPAAAPAPTAGGVSTGLALNATATAEAALAGQGVFSKANAPRFLPETGQLGREQVGVWIIGLILFAAGWILIAFIKRRKSS
jgi:uncharacterized repeat protein (TIGR01451 family)